MENPENIQDLRMYIPFIDYLASVDKGLNEKLLQIKEWILENKKLSEECFIKTKQSIIFQYNKLRRKNVKIPRHIVDIFKNTAAIKFETIDLCSDDEHTEKDSVAHKSSSSSKIVEKKDIETKEHKIDLSDGEIVDSDSDTISTDFRKPISFQISAEQNKVSDKENVYSKNSTKKADSLTNDVEKKDNTKEFKKQKSSSEINIRKGIEKEQCTPNIEKEVGVDKEDEETEALLKLIDKLCGKVEKKNNESIECMSISDNSIDEMAFELIKNKQEPAEATKNENKSEQIKEEEQIFTRRSYKIENDPVLLDDYDFKKKIKKRRKKRLSKTENSKSLQVCDISSDEDFVAVPLPVSPKITQKTEPVTFITLSDTDELSEKVVNEHIGECKTESNLLSTNCDDKKLEKLDINELRSIFTKLIKGSNIDLEHFLAEIANTDNGMNSSPTTSPYYAADNINMNDYVSNEYTNVPTQAYNINDTAMPKENFYNTSHVQEFQQQFPQMPQYPIMHQLPPQPPPLHSSAAPDNYPIFYINGQKINLKDPRVRQHLLSFQKSYDPELSKEKPPNGRFERQSNQRLPNSYLSRPSTPMTYLEYKRRKAEKALELERRKLAEEQSNLEKANNKKNKEIAISKSMETAPLCNSNNINESSPAQTTVEAIKYNNPKKTKPEETKKVTKTKELDRQPLPEKSRKSPLLETVETSTDNSSKKMHNATKIAPTKNPKKRKRKSSNSRVLKELECTVIGFDKLQDYLPLTLNGKRKSSESARSAISLQLNGQHLPSGCTTPEDQNNKIKRISMRRSSMGHALNQSNTSDSSPAPIAKRRKTCTEVSLATLLQDSSADSAEELTTESQFLIASSSDTDTFDFDDFKYKKSKAVALKNQPFVLLQRLTEEEINKHLRRKRPVPPEQMCLNVKLVEKTTQEAPECHKPPAPKTKSCKNVPNIDVRMTERNTTYCALCKSKPVNIVNHYIRTHKTEPYVSRLTSKELEDLQFNCPFAVLAGPSNARVPKYKVQCLFCADELVDSFINFYNHYSAHTGEYAFQCYNCELKKPYRSDIQSHKNQAKACRKAQIQKLYVYPTNLMVIYLHCCKLCNFVQLNEANVFKHLREQHAKRGDDAIYVQKYIAAAINDAEIVNELLPEETEFLARGASGESQESYSEMNCSEVDIKPDLSPYSSVLDDNFTQSISNIKTPMTTIPLSNMKATYTSSFLDKKVINKEDEDTNEVELPRPIIVKSEVKVESHSSTVEPPSNRNATHLRYRHYPPEILYFGVFKCMAIDCFFSTDVEDEMLQHLNDHGSSEYPPTGWLECSYCQLRHDACCKAEDLIAHIKLKHSQSPFQCSLCCYRSCEPSCVAIHFTVVHDSELDTIFMYECEGESKSEKERLPDMMMYMAEHVRKLQCKHCSLGFYAISALKKHLNKTHGILSDDPALHLEYSCIYCEKDLMLKSDMQEHIALEHPDELAYACMRFPKDYLITADVIDNLQLCKITEIVPLTSIRKPLTPATLVLSNQSAVEQKENTNNLSSEVCLSNQELNTTDSGIESVAPELLDEQRDLKPSPEQLVYIAEETLRALLNKLTSKTGISPDRLYHCPIATCGGFFSTHALWSRHMSSRHNCLITRCPHCPKHLELALSDFTQHFVQHCRHLYVCFHCSETFVNEQAAIAHFQAVHSNEPNFHFELIKFNLMHSYRIIMSESVSTERLEFYQILQDNVVKRMEQLAKEESSKLLSRWLVPASADWLEEYRLSNRSNIKTCIVKSCPYKTRNVEALFEHWEASHNITGDFKCSRCSVNIINLSSWQPIVEHVRMHDSYYVCSACNYHNFGQQQMATHTLLEHNSRDVPFVSLFQSGERTYVRAGVIFAAACKTFSTINTCFFCNAKNLSVQTLRKHFMQEHNVSMQHFCEICNIPFKDLSEVDAHHSSSHDSSQIKIRCEFVSHLQLIVRSTFPLSIDIMSGDLIATTRSKRSSVSELSDCAAIAQTTEHNKALCVEESAESFATQKRIKQEIPDDNGNASDSEVEIIEGDDLVCAEEFKARRNEQNKNATISETPRLRVKNLLDNYATSISPITVTQITSVNVSSSLTIVPISAQSNKSNILQSPTSIDATALMQTPTQGNTPNFTVTPISVQPNQSNILKQPATINSTALKQAATQVTKTTGIQNKLGIHSLLQQALYNNASKPMQPPTEQKQSNTFSSSSNVGSSLQLRKLAPQTINTQKPVFTHQKIQPKEVSSISNQGSSQQIQQTLQTIHPQPPVLNNQQIQPNKFSYTSNQGSSQQHLEQTQQTNHSQESLLKQQQIQGKDNKVSIYKTTKLQAACPQNPIVNRQNQHLKYVPQQIQPNAQQQPIQNKNTSILNAVPQTTYAQQPVVKNQQQHFGTVPQQIRPMNQTQQLQNTYNNSSILQSIPQQISVRLSAPDIRNQRIMNPPIVQHPSQQTPQIILCNTQPSSGQFVQQNWVPAPSLDVHYIATTNTNSSQQTIFTTQPPQAQSIPQSFNTLSSPHNHNYFH